MSYPNLDDLLSLGMSQAGYPPATPASSPAIKSPEHLQENDSSSISELEAQVKATHRAALQGFVKTTRDLAALKHCIRMHSTDCVEPITPSKSRTKATKALADLRARNKGTAFPLPRNEKRLSEKYRDEALQAEISELIEFIPQWQECKRCNP